MKRPSNLSLANWREHPYSQWSFQNVREVIATACITNSSHFVKRFTENYQDFNPLIVESPKGQCKLSELFEMSHTDGVMAIIDGELAYQWLSPHYHPENPHILFSISKSTTALLGRVDVSQW